LPPKSSNQQDLFAGRYELLREMPQGAGGRLFEARDIQTNTVIAVKVFRRELDTDAPERQDLQRVFETARSSSHPALLRYHALALDGGYLVREWAHGFCLVDLLRRRRELPAEELAELFDGVPDALDSAGDAGLAPASGLISRLFAAFDPSTSQDELSRLKGEAVSEWPAFKVVINPISLGRLLPISWDETMHTMSTGVVLGPGEHNLPLMFAEGVYELLGAPHRGGRGRRYVPISTLSEGGNAYLRGVLTGQTVPQSCAHFWTQFLRESDLHPPARRGRSTPAKTPASSAPSIERPAPASPPPPPPIRSLRIPDVFLKDTRLATILRLTPHDVSFTPVHLLARTSFKIGRSLYHADFITRVLPETAENEKLTKEIGRVHVLLERDGSKITIRDGNGEHGSVNGSRLDNAPLTHEHPVPLTGKAVVSLYRNYEIEIAPLLGSYDRGCEIKNLAEWSGADAADIPINGAIVFHPLNNQPSLRQAAWIFSRLDFSLSPRGDAMWCDAGSPASQGAFLYHRGHFWIANFQLPTGALSVNRLEITPGEVVPLVGHQSLSLGPGNYVVEAQ
jgi:pSer/pThr/pTyr-binding forkhead associated (FHA) protein